MSSDFPKNPKTEFEPNPDTTTSYVDPNGSNRARTRDVSFGGSAPGYFNQSPTYADYRQIQNNLDTLESQASVIINGAEEIMTEMALDLSFNSQLLEAQAVEWPDDLAVTRDFLHYKQYKVLRKEKTRGSDFLSKAYEYYMRGPTGSIVLDLMLLNEVIFTEVESIRSFLDKYIGEINDSSEYRVLELFQDWTNVALRLQRSIGDLFQTVAQSNTSIPDEEISQVTEKSASDVQRLFQVKVNTLNSEIVQFFEELNREYKDYSSIFYDKFLGPALKFRLDTDRGLQSPTMRGYLEDQALQGTTAFRSHFSAILADQMRRNGLFERKMNEIITRLVLRQRHLGNIKTLEPIGLRLRKHFSSKKLAEDEVSKFDQLVNQEKEKNKFLSAHNYIPGRNDDDAHAQYILKGGDEITGAIEMGESATIDGVKPSTHAHTGEDGTAQLDASTAIAPNTIVESLVKEELLTSPSSLRLIEEKVCTNNGRPAIAVKLGWDGDLEAEYEVQIVAICDEEAEEINCTDGHSGAYPVTACDHSADDRIFLNNGFDRGSYAGFNPITAGFYSPTFPVRSCFVKPIDSDYFFAGLDYRNNSDFAVILCRRNGIDGSNLEWEIKGGANLSSSVTTNTTVQEHVAAEKIAHNQILVGCKARNKPSLYVVTRNGYTVDRSGEAPLMETTDFAYSYGVHSLAKFSDDRFLAAYSVEDKAGGTYSAYVRCGEMSFRSGTTEYGPITYPSSAAVIESSAASLISHMQVLVLNPISAVVLWEKPGDGYYTQLLSMTSTGRDSSTSATTVTAVGTPYKIVDEADVAGLPQIKKANDGNIVVVWGEADTSAC